MSEKVSVTVEKIIIPTYPEPPAEELPMFAENRVHQRTSGRPYPNKVVMQVDRSHKEDREYTVVRLENRYLKIEILPEIGGRIYSALDKTTGYDFFYKQHVIKPALIGVLGSWISGGVEFNWPFHHRGSGFLPCDFTVEQLADGTAVCHLSEHDPIDRMKGMVSIVLRPDAAFFETKMRLYNRTDVPRSFLWWENAAVPVNEQYQIFFPQDVSYVNFHYLKSRTTFPVAGNGVYNGIPMDTDRDISWHKNTRQATSYFASASDYDFFGGYDHGKHCGVVHIGDHHVSPGKKMFTWAYCQLAKSWENALTDTDGQYAELMAGSYSDNQPNFSWLEPYETKEFSQYWYPITELGTPTFANLNCAVKIDRENHCVKLQTTASYHNARLTVKNGDTVLLDAVCDPQPGCCLSFAADNLPEYVSFTVTAEGKTLAAYREQAFDRYQMPDVITDMPSAAGMNSVQELYLAGVHVDQYRDPAVLPDAYWKEALKRDINHIPSLIAMAKYEYRRDALDEAQEYIMRAIRNLQLYNERTQSGEAYYVCGQIAERKGEYQTAYDWYRKSAWAADCVGRAMTRAALLDLRFGNYETARKNAETALDYGRNNNLALAAAVIAARELGETETAERLLAGQLRADPLDHTARFLAGDAELYSRMDSDPVQTCLDIAFDFSAMGRYADIVHLLDGLLAVRPECENKIVRYTLGYYRFLCGEDGGDDYACAENAPLGFSYPLRHEERVILSDVIARTGSGTAKMLLGCLLYNGLHYERAAALWEQCDDLVSRRNLAVAYFSHLNRPEDAVRLMKELVREYPEDQELLYETVVLLGKTGGTPAERIALIRSHHVTRDDILTELAKAYNQAFLPDEAIGTLLSHEFVPCEGGEHAIADQYMFAHLVKGKRAYDAGKTEDALELFRAGQILPQSLGAGIWNHCKLIPLRYHEALCLEKLGQTDAAREIRNYIAETKIEYFSNMHLKELPFWQAASLRRLGDPTRAQHLLTEYLREWDAIADGKDNGYFGTTPFFIPFVDDPAKLRRAQHRYLTGLLAAATGHPERAAELLRESRVLNPENLYAAFFAEFGFSEE